MRPHRGFATTMAIALIALLGVALAALTASLATTARQNRDQREAAQLRQMLLAGADALAADAAMREKQSIDLPEPLKAAGGELLIERAGNEVTVRARLPGRQMAQVLKIDEQGGIASTRLVE